MKKLASMLLIFAVTSPQAIADGEIFALKTTGTQYCPGFKPFHFTPASSTTLFLRMDNNTEVSAFIGSLKDSPDLLLDLQYDFIGTYAASFSLSFYADSANHVEVIGRGKIDKKTGLVKTITGTFIRAGLTDGCYAVGKLTGKRIN